MDGSGRVDLHAANRFGLKDEAEPPKTIAMTRLMDRQRDVELVWTTPMQKNSSFGWPVSLPQGMREHDHCLGCFQSIVHEHWSPLEMATRVRLTPHA